MTKITAIIPTYNEESNIQRALDSVYFADEIIVIDSFSTDNTVEIVKQSNATLLQREFDDFSKQKNHAISKAANDWVFLLDADETLTKELEIEVLKIINSNTNYSAFYIYRNFFFKEKKLKFSGWQRDKVIRLFKKSECTYQGKVHEEIETESEVGFLSEKINHYSYKNYKSYRNKLKIYAKLQAEELLGDGKFVTPYHLFIKPLVRFFIQYIIKLGFLDGYRGIVISKVHAFGVWRRYVELLKLKNQTVKTINSISGFNVDHKEKDVSIIIVNYKSWKHLKNCLEELVNFNQMLFSFEVIVVDNCSNDGRLKEFSSEYSQFSFIKNSGNNGFANGCNFGAFNSKGEHLLFLNPDTLATESAVKSMLACLKENLNFGIVSCNQQNNNGSYEDFDRIFPDTFTLFGLIRALYRKVKNQTIIENNIIFPDWVSGSVVFISRRWFAKIEGWNEDFWMYFEDVDLSKKVRDLGGQVALLKDVNIIHNHGGASRINIKTASITKTEVVISKHVYIRNHFTGIKRKFLLFLVVVSTLMSKLIGAIFGMIFFFVPKLRLGLFLFIEMIKYYYQSYKFGTWLSQKSMNRNV